MRTKDYRIKNEDEKRVRESKAGSGRLFTGKPTIFNEFDLKTSHQAKLRKDKSSERLFSIKSLEKPISPETINPFLNASELFSLDDLNDNNLFINKGSPLNKSDFELNNIINPSKSNLNLARQNLADSSVINYNFMNNNFYCGSNSQICNDKNVNQSNNVNAITSYLNRNNKLSNNDVNNKHENIVSGYLNQIKANQHQAKCIKNNIMKQQAEDYNRTNSKNTLNKTPSKYNTNKNRKLNKNSSTPSLTPLDMLYKPSDIRSIKNGNVNLYKVGSQDYAYKRMDKYLSSRNNNNSNSENFPKTKDIIIDEKDKKVIIEFQDAITILHKDLIGLDI